VTWTSELDVKTVHLPIPTSPGLGLDLNMDVVREHPCDPNAYFDTSKPGLGEAVGGGSKTDIVTGLFPATGSGLKGQARIGAR